MRTASRSDVTAAERGALVAMGSLTFDLATPHGRMMASLLVGIAGFARELTTERVCSGLAAAKARSKGQLRGKSPKLSDRQAREMARMHATGKHTIAELA